MGRGLFSSELSLSGFGDLCCERGWRDNALPVRRGFMEGEAGRCVN